MGRYKPKYPYSVKVKSYNDDRVGEWCMKNVVGDWLRDIDIDNNYEYSVETVYFVEQIDFVNFTLKWV